MFDGVNLTVKSIKRFVVLFEADSTYEESLVNYLLFCLPWASLLSWGREPRLVGSIEKEAEEEEEENHTTMGLLYLPTVFISAAIRVVLRF